MMDEAETKGGTIIFTGGSGLLGSEFRLLRPDILYPDATEFNVNDFDQMDAFAAKCGLNVMVHAAAFTSPPAIDREPQRALATNIVGTANVVRLCAAHGARLIYISTDYVFDGAKGNYSEDDPVRPVNKYAWSKLGGECAVRLYDNALIVRTSFGPAPFPFAKAFVDQWTTREPVAVIARKIAALLDVDLRGVIHVGGVRRTVIDYARSMDPGQVIGSLSINDVGFHVPADTSLNCERYGRLVQGQESHKRSATI
jgi:dTDP-4-dehydrorhamnose reductase